MDMQIYSIIERLRQAMSDMTAVEDGLIAGLVSVTG